MIDRVQDIRHDSLEATYLALNNVIEDGKLGKIDLKKLVATDDGDAFDQSVRLIIIDSARLYDDASRQLFSVTPGVVRRIIKCSWFFENAPSRFFIEELFPVVSVSTRLKVITALGKCVNETQADELYTYLRKNYGHRTAEPIFARCSDVRIRQHVFDQKKGLSNRAFIAINKRRPVLGCEIFKQFLEWSWNVPQSVTKDIAIKHPEFMSQINVKLLYRTKFRFGRKLLRSLMTIQPSMFSNIDYEFQSLVNCHRLLFMGMNDDIRAPYIAKMMLKDQHFFNKDTWLNNLEEVKTISRPLSALTREKLLEKAFQIIYGDNLWDHTEAWGTLLFEMVTPQRRAAMLELPLFQADKYIYLKPAAAAVPLLMDRVRRTPDPDERRDIVIDMIKTTVLDMDMDLLRDACDFILSHCKNQKTLQRVLNVVLSSFPTGRLPESVWKALAKLSSALYVIGEWNYDYIYPHEGYLGILLAKGGNPTDALAAWMKIFVDHFCYSEFLVGKKFPHAKVLVTYFFNVIELITSTADENKISNVLTGLLCSAETYNVKLIDLPDKGCTVFRIISKVSVHYDSVDMMLRFYRQRVCCDQYSNILKPFANSSLLLELLKHQSACVVDNMSELIGEIFDVYRSYAQKRIFRLFRQGKRLLHFFGVSQSIATICENAFAATELSGRRMAILGVYSFVASQEKFCQLAADFLPKGSYTNPNSLDSAVQLIIPGLYRFLEPIAETLPLVLPCLVGGGDFFYSALSTFHKICYTSPVAFATAAALPLLESPVSVKKKGIRIISHVNTIFESMKHFKHSWACSKHYSARIVLLDCFLQSFLEDPTPEMWTYFRQCLLEIDDLLLLPSIPSPAVIPDIFLQDFVSIVWKVIRNLDNGSQVAAKSQLIEGCCPRINLLQEDTCREIIQLFLFTPESIVNTFCVHYLLYGATSLQSKLLFLTDIFEQRADDNIKQVYEFILSFTSYREEEIFRDTFSVFKGTLKKYFDSSKHLSARLILDLTNLSQEIWLGDKYNAPLLVSVGRSVADLWCTMPDFIFLKTFFVEAIGKFFDNEQIPIFLAGFVRDHPTFYLVALKLLPYEHYWNAEQSRIAVLDEHRESVLDNIRNYDNSIVQLHLINYMKKRVY